jgi:hypothetical protein
MINFNDEPPRFAICDEEGMDETEVNLRWYVANLPPEKLAQYRPDWTDQQLMAWEENIRDDGHLLLVCCTRDVDLEEYRQALEDHLATVKS